MKLNYFRLFTLILFVIFAGSCSKSAPNSGVNSDNLRTNQNPIDTTDGPYRIVRQDAASSANLLAASSGDASKFLLASSLVNSQKIYSGKLPDGTIIATPGAPSPNSLLVGFPIAELGEQWALGGVVTKISNSDDEDLGGLKSTEFEMLQGKLMLSGLDGNSPQLTLVGCAEKCVEGSTGIPQIAFPIQAVDSQNKLLMLDLSALGKNLNLMGEVDPSGNYYGVLSKDSTTTTFDFTGKTLVFDVESTLLSADPVNNPIPDSTLTVRWYLKSASAFDPYFTIRNATPGIGFFMTDERLYPKIERFSLDQNGTSGIKYYIKNVPDEWHATFASSFDEWNQMFQKEYGRNIFDYEFIPAGDPRNDLLVTGDIRYNIVDWDLDNVASYGGLGPQVANQASGETLSANVFIQGPEIIKLYTAWYKAKSKADALTASGKNEAASKIMRSLSRSEAKKKHGSHKKHSLKLGKHLHFVIHSERPALRDPRDQRDDFDMIPAGVDYQTYMNGYFHDMLTHELGHNLGLRHNFRGNLGATDDGKSGSTSRSIMEYLGRGYRYLDTVGEYDLMAIRYGYAGILPEHKDWYCTDEDQWSPQTPKLSAECNEDDATSDPYSFFQSRLSQSIDYLTARGQANAPVWTEDDLQNELTIALNGLASYAAADTDTIAGFTNFFKASGRPAPNAVQSYVVENLKQQLCDPSFDGMIASKQDQAAKDSTLKAIQQLRGTTAKMFQDAGIDIGIDINCISTAPPPPVVVAPTPTPDPPVTTSLVK